MAAGMRSELYLAPEFRTTVDYFKEASFIEGRYSCGGAGSLRKTTIIALPPMVRSFSSKG